MKTFAIHFRTPSKPAFWASLLLGLVFFAGCKDEIDSSAYYTFTGETMTDHIANDANLSEYYELIKVTYPNKVSNSTVADLLSARGSFTTFLPTNQAIQDYLQELKDEGVVTGNPGRILDIEPKEIRDSISNLIVLNSVIDGGTSFTTFQTTDFQDGNNIQLPNMNNRPLKTTITTENNQTVYCVNTTSRIIEADIEVQNGYAHVVDKVVVPSQITLNKLIELNENMSIFAQFLELSGYSDELGNSYQDEAYEDAYLNNQLSKDCEIIKTEGDNKRPLTPEHRKIGYTIFAETNDVFAQYGIHDVTSLLDYLENRASEGNKMCWEDFNGSMKGQALDYSDDPSKFRNKNHALRQFVGYHILPMAVAKNDLVHHYNELNYDRKNKNITLPVFEYYYTLSEPRRLMKITESRTSDGIRLNRHKDHNADTYEEETPSDPNQDMDGILINTESSEGTRIEALNGYLYGINDLLVYSNKVAKTVLNERIRFDIAGIMPELMTNGMRRLDVKFAEGSGNKGFPPEYQYFDNVRYSKTTNFYYLSGVDRGWGDYQGDEFFATGQYDIYVKLPPVPFFDDWEIRYGIQANGSRGMCQVYFGQTSKEPGANETPIGLVAKNIPLDLRMSGTTVQGTGGNPSNIGWEKDKKDENDVLDEDYNLDVEKRLRNNGFMKGPNYFCQTGSTSVGARESELIIRRIILTEPMYPDQTYWVRFKSVMDDPDKQFFFDYIEMVPKSIYANPSNPEDKW
ncbi:MAG: fasciclin domain-containing protein [Paraprevotella sp.]|nr:fasciclin domain-containing protein [Paraprevotella sp.]